MNTKNAAPQSHTIRVNIASGFLLGEVPTEVRSLLMMLREANLIQFGKNANVIEYTIAAEPRGVIARWKSLGFKAEQKR